MLVLYPTFDRTAPRRGAFFLTWARYTLRGGRVQLMEHGCSRKRNVLHFFPGGVTLPTGKQM